MRSRVSHAALVASALAALACSGEGDRDRLERLLTAPDDGWTATTFVLQEYVNVSGQAGDEQLVTDVDYGGDVTFTFTDDFDPVWDLAAGEVVAPDGAPVLLHWGVASTSDEVIGDDDAEVVDLWLAEDAVLRAGTHSGLVVLAERDRVELSFGENTREVEAYLVLEPR